MIKVHQVIRNKPHIFKDGGNWYVVLEQDIVPLFVESRCIKASVFAGILNRIISRRSSRGECAD